MASAIGSIVTDLSDDEAERLRQAVWDLALGTVVNLPYAAKPPQNVRIEEVSVYNPDGEPGHIRVYIREPDPVMLRHLIEQNIGRPGSRLAREQEQVIQILHAIPGWDEEEEEIKEVRSAMPTPGEFDEEVNPWPAR